MTTATPELDSPQGMYGVARTTHVKNLLSRATVAAAGTLNPTIIRSMRRHYQVASCLLVQSLPLIRADWSIECEDDRVRETLTAAYRSIAFTVHRSMTRALWAGYSPNEIVWTYRDDLRGIYPGEIRDLVPETCKPALTDEGTLDGFVQSIGGDTDRTFDPIYTLWITEGMESGNYYGRSLLEAALDPWSDFAAIRAFHARYLERFGEPVVICRAPDGQSIANRAAIDTAVAERARVEEAGGDPNTVPVPRPVLVSNLDTALDTGENLRHHSVVALPSTLLFGADGKPTGFAWGLEYLESKGGGGDDFLNAENAFDKRIARAMFVPDTLSQNEGNTGSYAMSKTHKTVWSESEEGRLDDYSRQITAQLLEPARLLNFGEGSPPARLVFSPLTEEDKERDWQLVVALVETGELPVDARELAEKYDLPLLDESEVAARDAAAPVENSGPRPDPAVDTAVRDVLRWADDASAAHRFAAEDPTAGLPDWKIPQALNGDVPFARALNNRERRVGFARLEDGLNTAEAEILSALTGVLETEHDRILRQLAGIVRKDSPAEVLAALGTLEIKGGPAVVRAWSDLMATISELAVEGLVDELEPYRDRVKPLGPEGRALFKAYATTSADRVLSGLLTETRLELLNAYTSGVSRVGMASIVGKVFDAYAGSEGKPVRLTTRMLSAKSLNYTRAAAIRDTGIPLAGAQYSAILDRVTCDLCRKLDEQTIAITHTDLARFTPPVHHNCRCVWVWVTTDEEGFVPTWSTPSKTDVDRFGGLVF